MVAFAGFFVIFLLPWRKKVTEKPLPWGWAGLEGLCLAASNQNQGKAPFWWEPVVHFLEWSTGSFVFAGNQGKALILSELVVHFIEWTTGSSIFAGNLGKSPFLRELVVHFSEWTTGSSVFAGNQGKSPFWCEVVVHFLEWTTSSIQKSQQDGLAG